MRAAAPCRSAARTCSSIGPRQPCGLNVASFDYTVSDGTASTDTGTVTLDLTCLDEPPGMPTTKDQCKKGGWKDFGVFKNQGDCVSSSCRRGEPTGRRLRHANRVQGEPPSGGSPSL